MDSGSTPDEVSVVRPAGLDVLENVSLADFTTIGIGGPARWFVRAESLEQMRAALEWARESGHVPFILGGGSNLLIADEGWPGIVIHNGISGISLGEADGGEVLAVCGGGVNWDDLVRATVEADLQGIECLSGIPGTVGASPVQNIGAYGQEVKDTIEWVDALERGSGELRRFGAEECGFGYRWSRFKGDDRDKYVITGVAFRLRRGGVPQLRYGDFARYFESKFITEPTLAEVREAVLEIRRGKGMVVDPGIADSRSCGSFFVNPIVTDEKARSVAQVAEGAGFAGADQSMPQYPAGPGLVKLSAAWLMEKSGLEKGMKLGNVGLSTRHVLAIINCGGGSAAEVKDLVREVQNRVRAQFDIELVPEPVFVGFHDSSC